ncbi:nucleotidyltransferase domain-containing protein [Ferrimonas senticii]|uniref:nucleotidyltransferase domain-containing protein n=1 Tax=Ferrimonas senticii TaxID=394566 RepID=UPI0004197BF4|nr:nucleotidyltransferase domain-containing protein [Ferrimonas senticii]
MMASFPSSLPNSHRAFLNAALATITEDNRIVGVALAGSFATNTLDQFSDLDMVIAVEPTAHGQMMAERAEWAAKLSAEHQLLTCLTGEHVGEPRLLIGLYQADDGGLLHIDFKFVAVADAAQRVDQPQLLWARDSRLADALATPCGGYPQPQGQWLEDRFWVWLHYAAGKVGRGELFEALDFLSFLRQQVLGPLALAQAGHPPSGVRKLEQLLPEYALQLQQTVAGYQAADLCRAIKASASLYLALRSAQVQVRDRAQQAALTYLTQITTAVA